jgi:hypothetical protein
MRVLKIFGTLAEPFQATERRWDVLFAIRSDTRTSTALAIVLIAQSWSEQWVFPAARGDGALTGFAPDQAMGRIFADEDDRPAVHDIRRTVGTMLGKLGFNRLVQDRVFNHKDRGVGGIYDRHSYDKEKRAALEAWARELDRIVTGAPADNVVALTRREPP